MPIPKILLYTAVLVGGFVLISLWHFYSIIHPKEIPSQLTPEDINIPAEDVSLTAADGTLLIGWLIEKKGSAGADTPVLVLLHGYPTDKGDLLPIAHSLREDFTILLMDARYFGESGGDKTTLGIKEKKDVGAALDFLESRGHERIGIFGYSLGGATALMAAAGDDRVDALVTYGAFSDLRSLGGDVFSNLFFLSRPMTELVLFWGTVFLSESPMAFTPLDAARVIGIPTLISHAENDPIISVAHAHRLSAAFAENEQAETLILDEKHHFGIPDEVVGRAKQFFLENIEK